MERRARPPFRDGAGAWVVTRYRDALAALDDPALVVPAPGPGGPYGTLAWLRGTVCRFAEGEAHRRRRAVAAAALADMNPAALRHTARTQAAHALATADPAHVLATADPAHVLATADPAHVLATADPAAALGTADPAHVLATADPDHVLGTADLAAAQALAGERAGLVARRVPVAVLGRALGVAEPDELERLTEAVPVVAAVYLTGAERPETREAADDAVGVLVDLLGPGPAATPHGDPGHSDGVAGEWVANRIAVLAQACEATAGLIERVVHALGTVHTLGTVHAPGTVQASGAVHASGAVQAPGTVHAPGTGQAPDVDAGRWPVEAILAETVRFDPPVPALRRVAAAETMLGGQAVAPGDGVVIDVRAVNRDPSAFTDPDRFDPSRTGGARAITFGAGRRACPGAVQASALAAGVLEALVGVGVRTSVKEEA